MPVRRTCVLTLVLTVAAGLGLAADAGAQTKLLRFPDISGDQVVFSYGGDLWLAPATGGTARHLTTSPGQEMFARFSPDGQWIAFTGQVDGDEQVYVMPAAGGVPKQLTYYPAVGPSAPRHGYDNIVYGWTPDGKSILFRSQRDADGIRSEGQLFTVSVDGGLPVALPMPTAGAGDFSPDGTRMVYAPLFRDFRSWKRYQGGWAEDLYIFDLASHDARKIAATIRTERDPMWIGSQIVFASDRTDTLNLFSYDVASGAVKQLTDSTQWDVRWPSSDNVDRVVYELGGELHVYDVAAGTDTPISITVPSNLLDRRPKHIDVSHFVEDYELSPKGERALFVARGDIFSAPIEDGPTRNLTQSSGAHDKWARWSPDGASIAYISDGTGEEQLYVVDQKGEKPPVQLTDSLAAQLFWPAWSPDSKSIAFADMHGKLYVVDVATKAVKEIADDDFGGVYDYTWAPDGRWLAFSLNNLNTTRSLYIWSAADGQVQRVTGDMFSATQPAWDPDGNYLFYLSEREFAPQISLLEWNFAGNRMTGIFALALRKDVADPFPAESDEVTVEAKKDDADATPAKKGAKKADDAAAKKDAGPKPVAIDFDGLAERVSPVPVEADNIDGLEAGSGTLVYTVSGAPYYGRRNERPTALMVFDMKDRKAEEITSGVRGWATSADGKKVIVSKGGSYTMYDVKPKGGDAKAISTAGLELWQVPSEEWAEIYNEVWRRFRDYFYVRNMHGYDWEALGDQYRALLPYVAHRSDLNYVLTELVAELSVGHAYIQGGDFDIPERPRVGLPGARFELDPEAGLYRISKILAGQNEEDGYRAPLTEIGVDARVGDYVLAIDGEQLAGTDNPYRLLRYKTDPVTLTLNAKPTEDGARQVTYRPVFNEHALLYLGQVDHNREKVAEMTDGRVGYIHIPDMGARGAYEFIKWFYPQIRKEGLVVDVRSNGGGNISQWIIERLDTPLLGTRFGYASDHPATYPYTVFYGHKVCLINETSASDGDIFPARFKKAGLGPLVGKRTWGGVVGISGHGPLIDGGDVYVPQNATNDVDGSYIIEGHGVDPDFEVDNDPNSVIEGRDPQLEKGVALVLEAMEKEPMRLPTRPPDPVKAPQK